MSGIAARNIGVRDESTRNKTLISFPTRAPPDAVPIIAAATVTHIDITVLLLMAMQLPDQKVV